MNISEEQFYQQETNELLNSISREALRKVFSYPECELEPDFLGFLHVYADLQNLPKDFTVVDVGCCQALQAFYFKDLKKYIGIDPSVPAEYRLEQDNAEYYEATLQELAEHLSELNLDLDKVFAVCSYVPDETAQQLVSETFLYHRVVYCNDIISENYPKGFEPSAEYYTFCNDEQEKGVNEMLEVKGVLRQYEEAGETEVTVPEGVTVIGAGAFQECNNITKITLPESLEVIKKNAFYNCKNLTEVNIPDNVKKIDDNAFKNCEKLEKVTLPENLVEIGRCAFAFCDSLKEVTVPEKVAIIDKEVFMSCKNLEEAIITNGIIGESEFSNCENLKNVVISDNVQSVGDFAFLECSSLEELVIPDSVKEIGEYAFASCSEFTEVTMSKNVKEISNDTFSNCKKLESVKDFDGVEKIGYRAFENCESLKSIAGNSVKDFEKNSFSQCRNLKELDFPNLPFELPAISNLTIPEFEFAIFANPPRENNENEMEM